MRRPLQALSLYPPHGGSLSGLLAGRASVAPERERLVFDERVLTYAKKPVQQPNRRAVGDAAADDAGRIRRLGLEAEALRARATNLPGQSQP